MLRLRELIGFGQWREDNSVENVYLIEFFPIKHRCDALSAAVFTRGIQSLDGGNEVEALQQVVC